MSFCTVVNCIDGRVQLPVIAYLKNRFDVSYVDVVTVAGPVGVLSQSPESGDAMSIFQRVDVSIGAHLSKGIAIVAHHDCAGNPLPDSEQRRQLQLSLEILSMRYPELEVIGLWLDSNWAVREYPMDARAKDSPSSNWKA